MVGFRGCVVCGKRGGIKGRRHERTQKPDQRRYDSILMNMIKTREAGEMLENALLANWVENIDLVVRLAWDVELLKQGSSPHEE